MAQELAIGNVIKVLKEGGVGVLPTDTLYGLSASVFKPEAVEKIYKLKGKDASKPLIILINSFEDLATLGIKIDPTKEEILRKIWPGAISVILPCDNNDLEYLHRGTRTLAVRLPNKPDLIEFLQQTGPIISTSVNATNQPPASTIAEAKNYFGDQVNFYLDAGPLAGAPSTLISLVNDKVEILRQGAVQIPSDLLN